MNKIPAPTLVPKRMSPLGFSLSILLLGGSGAAAVQAEEPLGWRTHAPQVASQQSGVVPPPPGAYPAPGLRASSGTADATSGVAGGSPAATPGLLTQAGPPMSGGITRADFLRQQALQRREEMAAEVPEIAELREQAEARREQYLEQAQQWREEAGLPRAVGGELSRADFEAMRRQFQERRDNHADEKQTWREQAAERTEQYRTKGPDLDKLRQQADQRRQDRQQQRQAWREMAGQHRGGEASAASQDVEDWRAQHAAEMAARRAEMPRYRPLDGASQPDFEAMRQRHEAEMASRREELQQLRDNLQAQAGRQAGQDAGYGPAAGPGMPWAGGWPQPPSMPFGFGGSPGSSGYGYPPPGYGNAYPVPGYGYPAPPMMPGGGGYGSAE